MADSENTKPKKTIDELLAWAKHKGTEAAAKAPPKTPPIKTPDNPDKEKLSLDAWPEAVRGVPNAILRGSLFGISTERKIFQKRTVIASVEGYEIRFKGETFNQTDLDVFESLLHLAQPHPLGKRVEFSAHSLLKVLGRGVGGQNHGVLKDTVMRLITGGVEIIDTKGQKTYMGTLIQDAGIDESTGRWEVVFNKRMLKLYENGYTLVDWDQRQALGKNNLAKWLHGHYASHAKPFPYKVQTLMNLCGSTTKRLVDFRISLRAALDQLVNVGAILSWSIDPKTDLVETNSVPSQTQIKHMAKAAKRPVKRKI